MDHQNQQFGVGRVSFGPTGMADLGQHIPNVPVPVNSKIRDGVSFLETLLEELHASISVLESRVETVLTPMPPQPNTTGPDSKGGNGPASHVYDRVQSLTHAVREASARLNSLTARIEL